MARRKTSSALDKALLARSANRRQKLADDLASMRDFKTADRTGDSADVAFELSCDELSSQLAERDARELSQIEQAAARGPGSIRHSARTARKRSRWRG